MDNTQDRWARKTAKMLVGRTITGVRYMTGDECREMGWTSAAMLLILDNGKMSIWPSRDDEGNDAGAMFTTSEDLPIIPVT